MSKRIFVLLLAAAMMLSLVPVTAFATGNVCKIGDTEYASLQDAFDNAQKGDEVTLIDNIDYGVLDDKTTGAKVNIGKEIDLDLNGHTVKGKKTDKNKAVFIIMNDGTLTVVDKSDSKNGKILLEDTTAWDDTTDGVAIENHGALIIESGTIEATRTSDGMVYAIDNIAGYTGTTTAPKLTVNGGTLVSSYAAIRVYPQNSIGTASIDTVINGGTINANWALFLQDGANSTHPLNVDINGGTFNSGKDMFFMGLCSENEAKINISGDVISNNDRSVITYDYDGAKNIAKFVIDSGKFDYPADTFVRQVNCGESAPAVNVLISGGYYTDDDIADHVADDYECVDTPETDPNQEDYPYMVAVKKVARIGDKTYPSLPKAVSAAKNGDTIVMLEDVTGGSGSYGNAITKTIAVNLNGHKISGSYSYGVFYVYGGNLTIEDSIGTGIIENTKDSCEGIDVAAGGKLTINDGTIIGKYAGAYIYQSDLNESITVNGGKVLGLYGLFLDANDTITINGGEVYATYFAISTNGQCTDFKKAPVLNINGGYIHSSKVAVYLPAAGITNITGGKIEGYAGIGIKSGNLNIFGGEIIGIADDRELSDGSSQDNGVSYDGSAIVVDSNTAYAGNLNINISGGIIKGEHAYAIHEIGQDASLNVVSIKVTSNDAKIYGGDKASGAAFNLRQKTLNTADISITGGYYTGEDKNFYVGWDGKTGAPTTKAITELIPPGYHAIDLSVDDQEWIDKGYEYKIGELTSGKVQITETDNDVPAYYEKVSDLQAAIDNVTEANQEKFDKNESVVESTITVDNGADRENGIKAEIDDKVIIVADTNEGNEVKADPGYKMRDPVTEGGKTTYTAEALEIGKDKDGNTGSGTKASEKVDTKTVDAAQGVTEAVKLAAGTVDDTVNNKQLGEIISENLETLLSDRGINQGIAAKALNNAGIVSEDQTVVVVNEVGSDASVKYVSGSSISVFVRTYYDTEVKEDKTNETTNKSYTLEITPKYQAYASTVNTIEAMVAEEDTTDAAINAVKIGESIPVDCTGRNINLKIELPDGFITNTSQHVYVIHTLANGTKKIYNTAVTKSGEKFYIEFTNPDAFSEFEITLTDPNAGSDYGGGSTAAAKKCPQDKTCVYAKFTDADTKAWYHDGVHFCVENGYMIGVAPTQFAPDTTLSRAMIVTMLWRLEKSPVTNYAMSFDDVLSGEWYTEAVRWAQSTKIVTGYNDECFAPNDNITREQLAAILMRYADYKNISVTKRSNLAAYTDTDDISGWALESIKWANAVGIINGRTDTTIVPTGDATRAEVACMFQRFCKTVLK